MLLWLKIWLHFYGKCLYRLVFIPQILHKWGALPHVCALNYPKQVQLPKQAMFIPLNTFTFFSLYFSFVDHLIAPKGISFQLLLVFKCLLFQSSNFPESRYWYYSRSDWLLLVYQELSPVWVEKLLMSWEWKRFWCPPLWFTYTLPRKLTVWEG